MCINNNLSLLHHCFTIIVNRNSHPAVMHWTREIMHPFSHQMTHRSPMRVWYNVTLPVHCLMCGFQRVLIRYFDGLVQESRKSIAHTLKLRLSCTNPSICSVVWNSVLYLTGILTNFTARTCQWELLHRDGPWCGQGFNGFHHHVW